MNVNLSNIFIFSKCFVLCRLFIFFANLTLHTFVISFLLLPNYLNPGLFFMLEFIAVIVLQFSTLNQCELKLTSNWTFKSINSCSNDNRKLDAKNKV